MSHEQTKAEAVQASGGGSAEGQATEAAVAEASRRAVAAFSELRLCKGCIWQEKNIARPASLKDCINPFLPINLVTGERKFPCVIARGYETLCGPLGFHWRPK